MVSRSRGTFVCVSSTGGPFMGAYETLKAAQVALADTLDAELAETGVTAFTIGPGPVPTVTASEAIERVAPPLGMSIDAFYTMNQGATLSVEAAGAGRQGDVPQLPPLEKLAAFYGHLADLARGYVKDPAERDAQVALVSGWQADVERLRGFVTAT